MGTQPTYLHAGAFDAERWRPFGWVPLADSDERDGLERLHFEWADPHVNLIRHTQEEVGHIEGNLVCTELFRHETHAQVLYVIDEPCVVAVARAGSTFRDVDDLRQIEGFVLDAGQAIVLHRGTWHWGPFPLEAPVVNLFNVQGRRYIEDNDRVSLSHLDAALCVTPSPE